MRVLDRVALVGEHEGGEDRRQAQGADDQRPLGRPQGQPLGASPLHAHRQTAAEEGHLEEHERPADPERRGVALGARAALAHRREAVVLEAAALDHPLGRAVLQDDVLIRRLRREEGSAHAEAHADQGEEDEPVQLHEWPTCGRGKLRQPTPAATRSGDARCYGPPPWTVGRQEARSRSPACSRTCGWRPARTYWAGFSPSCTRPSFSSSRYPSGPSSPHSRTPRTRSGARSSGWSPPRSVWLWRGCSRAS